MKTAKLLAVALILMLSATALAQKEKYLKKADDLYRKNSYAKAMNSLPSTRLLWRNWVRPTTTFLAIMSGKPEFHWHWELLPDLKTV